ncbi:MAG: serine hydroxymethyltransferase [Zetaproteobacteria bacterium]|nr:serine hydroxymethyltransferase [Zetaproteobacteria bacterium]
MEKPWLCLEKSDPQVFQLIEQELVRQTHGIELIASENFASSQVIATMGNILTNKYAEGRPQKRYYGGCEVVDQVEQLAIDRACQLFGAKFANVQPHSGAQANTAVFVSLLKAGDSILGLDLSHGGHLTHGSPVNFSGLNYNAHFYHLNPETDRLDMAQVRERALEVRPKLIIAGASAYSRTLDFAAFRRIADEVGAFLMVDMAHIAGLVAAGVHPSPLPYADVVTTTTHKTLRGPRGGIILWNREELSAALNKGVFPGTQGGPCEHIIAAKAVCFGEALMPDFVEYQQQVVANASVLAAELIKNGLKVVSGGTDNHLVLLDLSETECSGKQLEEALGRVEITVNKNTVPRERRSPFVTSGVRLGTPAVTRRGMREEEMKKIAQLIVSVYQERDDASALARIATEVRELMKDYPLYPDWYAS